MINLIYNYFSDINNILTWILSMIFISLSILFWKLLVYIIRKFRFKTTPIRLDMSQFNANDIFLNIKRFDGYNYTFELDIDKFNAKTGQGVVISSPDFKKNILLVSKNDVSIFDVFKILWNSFIVNHNFKDKESYIKLSDKTTTSLRRLLINHGLIN